MAYLAQKIATETAALEACLKEANLPLPSFDVDADPDFAAKLPEAARRSRQEIVHATKELRDLTIGPRESVRWQVWGHLDVLALQTVNAFGLAKLFPVGETITLAELTARSKLDAVNLARLVRYAATNNIFREVSPGVIAHTAASRCIAEDEDMQAWIGFNTEDIFPASAHVLQALRTYPEAVHLTQTGFNFAFNTVDQEPMFVTFGKDPVRAKRMGRAMASLTGGEGYEVKHLVDGYDFAELDGREGTFVDVGGSHGFVCVDLAKKYKKMKFVVQDLPKTVETAPSPISEDGQVAERIRLQAHDFFTEQPEIGADVYFFRWIMHNYSTPYAIKLIKNLIPALKPGAKVLIMDHCLTEPGTQNPWDEKQIRSMDLIMLCLLNAQERTEQEFKDLFAAADEGFVFKGVIRPPGAKMGIIEAVWKPEEEAKEAAVAAPVEVEGVKAVLAEETEGAKVIPAEAEAVDNTAAKE
ncbi:S-adenosyl-L-methionine-dependent methyltransferase [Coniochaeta ligniaria NRRL 30616]|uniref:S-adenosyl-L-methionine-dependent methyltransferase n=1 Tax=Coniochaeta ligniaria NRRL 30616 TaxID=1408157 RepID=A0A1J7JPE2_9PEZI|nr:S-adenosyl-L-methionine-dependent methyltransferase [Coniochaeta ligniaria NRRL 30616]